MLLYIYTSLIPKRTQQTDPQTTQVAFKYCCISALDWSSARTRCLDRKLCFLHRITADLDTLLNRLSSHMFCALSDDIESTCLVRECLELEDHFELDLTRSILAGVCASVDNPQPMCIECH